MDFFEAISRRFSVRSYRRAPVEEAALQAILEAANSAPSAGNLQAYEIVVVRDPRQRRRLAKARLEKRLKKWLKRWLRKRFIAQAPVALVFVANPDRNRAKYGARGAELYSLQDATIACAYAQLAATAAGLGSCWVGGFDKDIVRHIIGAPAEWQPIAILSIGVPAETAGPRKRRPLSDLVHEEQARR
jgi:nitroreductase